VLREDYVHVLMEQTRKNGATLRLGFRVEKVDDNSPAVILTTGERKEADLVVGADAEWRSLLSASRRLTLK
jgi:2-polyprenyl-6-methoxyphenol hydroxylase-like FAD-dependent oxidoreductase